MRALSLRLCRVAAGLRVAYRPSTPRLACAPRDVRDASRGGRAVTTEAAAAAAAAAETMPTPSPQELLQHVARLVPDLAPAKYKGQAGKIAVVGGCREYTGAPFFAAMAALKIGADLSHVFCTDGAATVIKCYSPELIVHPYLPDSWQQQQQHGEQAGDEGQQERQQAAALAAIEPWLDRFDAVLVGPGLGRDPLTLSTVAQVMRAVRERGIPMVIDADGLWLVNQDPSLVKGYRNAVLTPNKVEFQRLADRLGVEVGDPQALQRICQRLEGPVVVRKGAADAVAYGRQVVMSQEEGSPRRAGGQASLWHSLWIRAKLVLSKKETCLLSRRITRRGVLPPPSACCSTV